MGSFAADHVIADPELFAEAVRRAVEVARDDWLVTLGIEPTFPSSAFGYVHVGDPLPGHPGAAVVRGVRREAVGGHGRGATSRPAATAGTPACSWSGRRCCSTCSARWHPEFAAALRAIAADPDRLDELWPALPKIALDHAVAEPAADAGRVAVVPSSFRWEDIGDFDALATLLEQAGRARSPCSATPARCSRVDSTGLVVPGERPGRRRRRARRRGRRRHPGRAAGDHPRARPGGQADRRRAEGVRPDRADRS